MTEIVKNLLIKIFFTLYLNDTPYDGWTDRQTKFSIFFFKYQEFQNERKDTPYICGVRRYFKQIEKWVEADRLIFYSECAENLLIIK